MLASILILLLSRPALACEAPRPVDVPILHDGLYPTPDALISLKFGLKIDAFEDVGMHQPAPFPTIAYVGRDAANFYILVDAVQPQSMIKSDAATSADVQKDDFAGVSFIVGSNSYVLFSNPAGRKLSLSTVAGWTGPWEASVSTSADGWRGFFTVPISSISSASKREPVRIAVFRQKQRVGGRYVYWPSTSCDQLSPDGESLIQGLLI